jgi:hypothetical protein
MPGAHPPAKYICLLLAMQRNLCPVRRSKGGNRGGKSAIIFCPTLNQPVLLATAVGLMALPVRLRGVKPIRSCRLPVLGIWPYWCRPFLLLPLLAYPKAQVAVQVFQWPIGLLTCQQSTFACCWLPVLYFDLATQLMPAALLPAKYLCLLLGTFAFLFT